MVPDATEVRVEVIRDGWTESVHIVDVAWCDAAGLWPGEGPEVFPRSALKPFQAAAILDVVHERGQELPLRQVAIATASHEGTADHQIEAAQLLALAGLDEEALRCPPAWPADDATMVEQGRRERLAHNCSGKHAGFLLATVLAGESPNGYLSPDAVVQRRVRDRLAETGGSPVAGPAVDGCGAPAWRMPLGALARAFRRLAEATDDTSLVTIRTAMRRHPFLVGGGTVDTGCMRADPRVIAKRGAEGVYGAGLLGPGRPAGLAIKARDGAGRAAAAVLLDLLARHGLAVPPAPVELRVWGGGDVHGELRVEVPSLLRERVPSVLA